MGNGPQVEDGAGEADEPTMAEGGVEGEMNRLASAQDRDLQETQRREQQEPDPDGERVDREIEQSPDPADGPQRARRVGPANRDARAGIAGGGIQGGIDAERVEQAAERRPQPTSSAAGGAFDVERVEEFTDRREELRQRQETITQARQSGAISAGTTVISDEARTEAATEDLTEFVGGVERRFGIDIPGEGPVARDVGEERDFGNVGGEAGRDFEELLEDIEAPIVKATTAETGAFSQQFVDEPIEPTARGSEAREFSSGAVEGATRLPLFFTGAVGATKDLFDVTDELFGEAITEGGEEANETSVELVEAGVNRAALAADQAVSQPFRTAGAATGSVIATGPLFAGARAIGPRASEATRLAIQPGEELLGTGGFRATRAVAGERQAQRFFPDEEPLIFSEEAFIRQAQRVSDRFRDVEAESVKRQVDLTRRQFLGRQFGGVPVPRSRAEVRREREVEELLDDDLQESLERMERAQRRRVVQETQQRRQFIERGREMRPGGRLQVEQELEAGRELDRRFETTVLDENLLQQAEASLADQGVIEGARTRLQQAQTTEVDVRADAMQRADSIVDTEIESDIETDLEAEQRAETEAELREIEDELEQEIEDELEQETRAELEAFDLFEDESPRDKRRLGLDLFAREFEFERDLGFIDEIEADLEDLT